MIVSADIPRDLKSHFAALQRQAYSLLRTGNYALAEKIYRAMLDTIVSRQEAEHRRIHKGSFFHQIGFALVLQDRLLEALKNFLLAYVEDTLNAPLRHENNADRAPAARVLRNGFNLDSSSFQAIKDISRVEKEANSAVINPETILDEYLNRANISQTELLSLCHPPPTKDDLLRQLIVNITPDAQKALNEITSNLTQKVLHIAADIAKNRGHREVTEDDIRDAIEQLEEKSSE